MNFFSRRRCITLMVVLLPINSVQLQAGPAVKKSLESIDPQQFQQPKPIKLVEPEYPFFMARAGLIGAVTLEFIIDTDGVVKEAFVTESNNPWFERPAIEAILRWKFQPGMVQGRAVNVRATQKIEFDLKGMGRTPELWRVSKTRDHKTLPPEFQWDKPPIPVNTLFPVYPFELLKNGMAGKTKISYVVGPNGSVVKAQLNETTTPEFGAAVLAMIDAWRFHPGKTKDGKPCHVSLGSEYEFKPNGRGDVPVSDEAIKILKDLDEKPDAITAANELDEPLRPMSRRPPVYPTALMETGPRGEAVIEFFIDKKGDAQLPRVVSASAPEFGYAAVQSVATWGFQPPKKKGKTTVVRVRVPVEFTLNPTPPASEADAKAGK